MTYKKIFIHSILLVAWLSQFNLHSQHIIPHNILNNSNVSQLGGSCCCGTFMEMNFPNLDFEGGIPPPIGGFIVYSAGQMIDEWTVTRATIDHCEGSHANLGAGNPNGASNFIDLHGSPGFGGIKYKLTGLTPGNSYRIDFWTAQNGGNHSSTGTLLVANGAWLNVSWVVTISGSVAWFKQSYMFMAMADMADMEFSSVGDLIYAGTLIDDIKIFECPGDQEEPMITNEPQNEIYNCIGDVPKAPKLIVTDNCDANPTISFKETTSKIDKCEQLIKRDWEILDKCGNKKLFTQEITVKDEVAPNITIAGKDKIILCSNHTKNTFLTWLFSNAGASATDNCKKITWDYAYDSIATNSCDTTLVDFIVSDECDNTSSFVAKYIIIDTISPKLINPAKDVLLQCSPLARDSLRNWLQNHGSALATDNCSSVAWTNNFKGDSSALINVVDFYAIDHCGNKTKTTATFIQQDYPDTIRFTQYDCSINIITIDTQFFQLPGCDSLVIINKIPAVKDSNYFSFTTCDPFQKSLVIDTLINMRGCDSFIISSYKYVKPDTSVITNFNCTIIDTSITYQIVSKSPCDSVIKVIQIPAIINELILNQTTCDSTKIGIDTLVYKNIYSCDSTVYINTIFSPLTINYRDSFLCTINNIYKDTLIYQTKTCDSLVIIQYKPKQKDTLYIETNTCQFQNAGIFNSLFTNKYGCDSLVIEKINFIAADTLFINKNVCNIPIQLIDTLYYPIQGKCDSVVFVNNIFHTSDTTYLKQITCDTNQVNTIINHLQGQYCDSVIISKIELRPSSIQYHLETTCFKDSVRSDSLFLMTSLGCDSMIVTKVLYEPMVFDVAIDHISCFGMKNGSINVDVIKNVELPLEYILNGVQVTNNDLLNKLDVGTYTLIIKDKRKCKSDSILFQIIQPDLLNVDAGKDLHLKTPTTINLKANTNRVVKFYHWFPESLFSCSSCETTEIQIHENGEAYILVTDQNGCQAIDTILFILDKSGQVFIPTLFSPNGDGINDYFIPVVSDPNIQINSMKIFDRWGELLFQSESVNPAQLNTGWNGIFKNKPLNPGVYLYLIEGLDSNLSKINLKGEVTLIR